MFDCQLLYNAKKKKHIFLWYLNPKTFIFFTLIVYKAEKKTIFVAIILFSAGQSLTEIGVQNVWQSRKSRDNLGTSLVNV